MKGKVTLLLLLCMLVFTGCSSTCKADSCENERTEGAKYCVEHICAEPDCSEGKTGENYCKKHFKCATEYCEDERKLESLHCVEHSKASTLTEIEIALKELITNDNIDNIYHSDFTENFSYWGDVCTVEADSFKTSKAAIVLNGEIVVQELTEDDKENWEKAAAARGVSEIIVPEVVVYPQIDFDLIYYMRLLILEGAILSDGENKFTTENISSENVDSDYSGVMEELGVISLFMEPDDPQREAYKALFESDNLLKLRLLAYSDTSDIDFSLTQEDTACIREVFNCYMQLKEMCNTDAVYFVI